MLKQLKKLYSLLDNKDRIKLWGLFLMMIIASGIEAVGIGFLPAFMLAIVNPHRISSYPIIGPIVASFHFSTMSFVYAASIFLILIFLLKNLYVIFFYRVKSRFIFSRQVKIENRLFRKYLMAPYTLITRRNSAELIRNLNEEINIAVKSLIVPSLQLLMDTVMVLSLMLLLLIADPFITGLSVSLMGISGFVFLRHTNKKVKKYGKQVQIERRNKIKIISQSLGALKEIKIMGREPSFLNMFLATSKRAADANSYNNFVSSIPKPIIETIAVIGIVLIVILSLFKYNDPDNVITLLTLFGVAALRLMPAVRDIVKGYTNIKFNLVAVDPIFNDLRGIPEPVAAPMNPFSFDESLVVDNVSFKYPDTDKEVLKDVNVEIKKGQSVGFVGKSGSGKSTLVDLITGVYHADSGMIAVDGKNVQENLQGWQQRIGYIPQTIYIFDDTIRNNIAIGISPDEIDQERLERACELAELQHFIDALPNGYNTIVGERGVLISGGQRQRIGLARILYNDPDLIILDEGTSALDNITERNVIENLYSIGRGRTLIMVAHRLSTVKNCDFIYVFENGRVVDSGVYEDLLSRSDLFKVLVE